MKVRIVWGVATAAKGGENESGDRCLVKFLQDGALLAVVDGLGHGGEAALAAQVAISVLEQYSQDSVISLVYRCHEALKGSRGVVMSLAAIDNRDHTMTWLGIGNVEGVLLRADPEATPDSENVVLRRGVVGARLPVVRASLLPLMAGDTLIFASDGIRAGFESGLRISESPQLLADRILKQHAMGTDDALVLVARYGEGCR